MEYEIPTSNQQSLMIGNGRPVPPIVINRIFYSKNHSQYTVRFHQKQLFCNLTSSSKIVNKWIDDSVQQLKWEETKVVGFAVNTNGKSFPAASILQLSVGERCLLVKLAEMDAISTRLIRFITHEKVTLVGLGNYMDPQFLKRFNNTAFDKVSVPLDVRGRGIMIYGIGSMPRLECTSYLAAKVFRYPREWLDHKILATVWDEEFLSIDQVLYATFEVFLSWELWQYQFA